MRLDYLDKMRIANGFKEAFECPPEVREAGERLTAWAFEAIAEARAFYAEHGEWCREEHHIGFSMTDDPGNARRWTELVRTDPYAARVSKDEEARRGLSIVTDGTRVWTNWGFPLDEGLQRDALLYIPWLRRRDKETVKVRLELEGITTDTSLRKKRPDLAAYLERKEVTE